MTPVEAVERLVSMDDRAYRSVVLCDTMADVSFEEMGTWVQATAALLLLRDLRVDRDLVLAFRGEDVPADFLTAAVAAGLQESEIRTLLASGQRPADAVLLALAGLRGRTERLTPQSA